MATFSEEEFLLHYGTPRHSGRYPWGSGDDESSSIPRNMSFLDHVESLKKSGLTEVEVAKAVGLTTTQLRAAKSIEKNRVKQDQINQAQRLKDKGYSNVAIGERMKLNESSVRALLAPGEKDKLDILHTTANRLKDRIDEVGYLDVGTGVESHIGVSRTKLNDAIVMLEAEGYKKHYVKIAQLGTGKETSMKVLAAPGVPYSEVFKNRYEIKQFTDYSEDGGRTFNTVKPPLSISSKRVGVRYAEQGGTDADGVIYVRPGVKDVSLGGARYAQVRVAVDGSHYLKGMAMYKDDLPDGVDLVFNTNKSDTGRKLDAMKAMKDDPENPFGAVVRQIHDETGKPSSAMNIVNEEGKWDDWSKTLSSQMLSKQTPALAKRQLDLSYKTRKDALDEVLALSNPTVKKKLLASMSDDLDSAAVHLKAAAIPRQRTQVILPVNTLKDTEIYAPNFRSGEKVALVRYPHGGVFEIPELTVNNNHPDAKRLLGNAKDAVGINAKVAERLSGADFDGDTVLVIPNNSRDVKTAPALAGLKNFDPKSSYPPYDGMKTMGGGTYDAKTGKEVYPPGKKPSGRTKGFQMGDVSNLITDMTIKGASSTELAAAVRHSMVVIDAEKHLLDWKASAKDNGIANLKAKYQGRKNAGASTLISKATSDQRVLERELRKAAEGGPIDTTTGKKVYVETGASYVSKSGKTVVKTTKTTKLAEAEDAHTLSSGTKMEEIYAEYSNNLKTLANQARLEQLKTPNLKYSDSARVAYKPQVQSLNAKLAVAVANRPLERQAQVVANGILAQKRQANPDMEADELKKVKAQALTEARDRVGAKRTQIDITDEEWSAIQAGAISNSKLSQILDKADIDQVKKLATPKASILMTPTKTARAQAMLNSGYTQAEVADALGVSLTTLKTTIGGAG